MTYQWANRKTWLSVIMPTWNGSAFLRDSLDSIVAQNENDLEIIVIDDGSDDSTIEILECYSRNLPINIVRQQHSGNWVKNTNTGLSMASGEYISFLHQDDLWLPGRLKILRKMTNDYPDVMLMLHPSVFIDTIGRKIGIWRCPLSKDQKPILPSDIFPKLLVQNFISIPAPCFRREAVKKTGLMDEQLWYTADWKFWLQLASAGKTLYYPSPLSAFRIHSSSQTVSGSANLLEFRQQMQTVLDQYLPLTAETKHLAEFSIEINTAMAALTRGQSFDFRQLLKKSLSMSPVNWRQYFSYSRIIERGLARIRAGFLNFSRSENISGVQK